MEEFLNISQSLIKEIKELNEDKKNLIYNFLFDPAFMQKYTKFHSFEEFKLFIDIELLSSSMDINSVILNYTSFKSFDEMLEKAAQIHINKELDNLLVDLNFH